MMDECNIIAAPDTLQLNMEIISKELNDLIVTGEHEFGVIQQFSMATVKSTAHSFLAAPVLKNNCQAPTYIANACYGHQQLYASQQLQNMKCNLNYYPTIQPPVPSYGCIKNTPYNVAGNPNALTNKNYLCAGKYLPHSSLKSTQTPHSNATGSPSYEFHYLQTGGKNEKNSSSMHALGSQGAYRKIKQTHADLNNQKMQNTRADNEEVKFDYSAIDALNNDKENSIVHHLFDLLRDLHCAVAETPPSFELETDSQFVETFAPANKKCNMPSTLNVQNQVKHACRKLTIFTYEMQRILSAIKMFDTVLHGECEFYLNQLRQYLNQLEMYKRIVMEHKHGQFLREEVKAHAERLSILLEHTNRQIREVNGRILAGDWYIGVTYRGEVHVAAQQFNRDNNEEISKKSKIGVINEILQLCNMKETIAVNANTTNVEETEQIQTPNKTDNSPMKLINNQEGMNIIKPCLYKNNEIFNAYKSDQIKRAANATGSHTRHPVFYIG